MDVASAAAKNANKTLKTGVSGSGTSLQAPAEAAPGDFAKQLLNALKLTKPWNVGKSEAAAAPSSQAGHAPRHVAHHAEARPARQDDPTPRPQVQAPREARADERDRVADARSEMIREANPVRDSQDNRPIRESKSTDKTDKPAKSQETVAKTDKTPDADPADKAQATDTPSTDADKAADTTATTEAAAEGTTPGNADQVALATEMTDPGMQILMQLFVQKTQVQTATTQTAFGLADQPASEAGPDGLGEDAMLAGQGDARNAGANVAKGGAGQFNARLMGMVGHLQAAEAQGKDGAENVQSGADAFLQALSRKIENQGVDAKVVDGFASARAAATAVAALDAAQGPAQIDATQINTAIQNVAPVGASAVAHTHQSASTAASGDIRSAANLPPAEQVAVQVQRALQSGKSRITVELDPAELGKVEVRLDIDRRGQVMASITAERPDTLDMLQKDARSLEKALSSAGLSTDMASLNFSLREGPKEQAGQQAHNRGRNGGRNGQNEDDAATAAIGEVATAFDRGRRVSLDRALDVIA